MTGLRGHVVVYDADQLDSRRPHSALAASATPRAGSHGEELVPIAWDSPERSSHRRSTRSSRQRHDEAERGHDRAVYGSVERRRGWHVHAYRTGDGQRRGDDHQQPGHDHRHQEALKRRRVGRAAPFDPIVASFLIVTAPADEGRVTGLWPITNLETTRRNYAGDWREADERNAILLRQLSEAGIGQ
jgi:hypothetical protein